MNQINLSGTIDTVTDTSLQQEAQHIAEREAKQITATQKAQILEAVRQGLKIKIRQATAPRTEAPLFGEFNAKQSNLF